MSVNFPKLIKLELQNTTPLKFSRGPKKADVQLTDSNITLYKLHLAWVEKNRNFLKGNLADLEPC